MMLTRTRTSDVCRLKLEKSREAVNTSEDNAGHIVSAKQI